MVVVGRVEGEGEVEASIRAWRLEPFLWEGGGGR